MKNPERNSVMRIEPVPGDPSTEPVATDEQSHVDGRVGPPTIAQDAAADAFAPEGVEQIEPGVVLPADTPWRGGVLPGSSIDPKVKDKLSDDSVPGNDVPQSQQSGPVKSEHPTATKAKGPKD